jgi:hypothetical protein
VSPRTCAAATARPGTRTLVRLVRARRRRAHRPGPAAAATQDSPATVTLRMTVRARKDLVAALVAMANQLRAHLDDVLPGAVPAVADREPGAPGMMLSWRISTR